MMNPVWPGRGVYFLYSMLLCLILPVKAGAQVPVRIVVEDRGRRPVAGADIRVIRAGDSTDEPEDGYRARTGSYDRVSHRLND